MSDYTPTTEQVRLDYCPIKTFPADADEQFDRWLAEVKAQERERIIKMLETVKNLMTDSDEMQVAIQLIQSGVVDTHGYNWINEHIKVEEE